MARVLVIGLDSVPPELLFDRYLQEMPYLRSLLPASSWGPLRSCDPPITVPAWRVMTTGKSPQELGVYGFRHRRSGDDYRQVRIADSRDFTAPAVWDVLKANGKKVCLIGIPPSYPPFPVDGNLVSCFLTPKDADPFTHPPELSGRIKDWFGDVLFDVEFRTDKRDDIIENVYAMSRQKFDLTKRLLAGAPWDFAMMVDIGPDRMHHAFWKFCDPSHPKHAKGNRYENVLRDYYRFLDDQIRTLMDEVKGADTAVYIVSDHGSKGMKGCFCVNEWLIKKGYLVLKNYPSKISSLEACDVDWGKTTVWGWGGYYARIFINLEAAEPQGIVEEKELEGLLARLRTDLENITGPDGNRLPVKVFESDDSWSGNPSKFLVYFGNLDYRSAGTLGHGRLFIDENDTGPDDSVHSMEGVYLRFPGSARKPLEIKDLAGIWLEDLEIEPVPTIWLTGLPRAGKTTLAAALQKEFARMGKDAVVFDGDELRKSLSSDLGFSRADRTEHVRRVSELCRKANREGKIAIAALISPYRDSRESARRGIGRFLEVFVDCPVEVCAQRDHKGLYARARQGRLQDFTGVSAPYEAPLRPEVAVRTDREDVGTSVEKILEALGLRHEARI